MDAQTHGARPMTAILSDEQIVTLLATDGGREEMLQEAARMGAMWALQYGPSAEQSAISAAEILSMLGVPLNNAGAVDLCHGFTTLRLEAIRAASGE